MFTCGDCKVPDCQQENTPEAPQCDEFDSREPESAPAKPYQPNIHDVMDMCIGVHEEVMELQRRFDTVIAAIVKATSPEEDR